MQEAGFGSDHDPRATARRRVLPGSAERRPTDETPRSSCDSLFTILHSRPSFTPGRARLCRAWEKEHAAEGPASAGPRTSGSPFLREEDRINRMDRICRKQAFGSDHDPRATARRRVLPGSAERRPTDERPRSSYDSLFTIFHSRPSHCHGAAARAPRLRGASPHRRGTALLTSHRVLPGARRSRWEAERP